MTNADIETVSSRTLSDAKVAARQGELPRTYKLARSVTSLAPEHSEGWLWRALTADTRAERLRCLSRAIELDPKHEFARNELYDSLWALLEQEPALICRLFLRDYATTRSPSRNRLAFAQFSRHSRLWHSASHDAAPVGTTNGNAGSNTAAGAD